MSRGVKLGFALSDTNLFKFDLRCSCIPNLTSIVNSNTILKVSSILMFNAERYFNLID